MTKFGELTFGEMTTVGEMTFSEPTRHRHFKMAASKTRTIYISLVYMIGTKFQLL